MSVGSGRLASRWDKSRNVRHFADVSLAAAYAPVIQGCKAG